MSEMVSVTYIGMGARGKTIEVKDAEHGFKSYQFRVMRPQIVPSTFAAKLASKPFFLLGDDSPLKTAIAELPKGSRIAFHRFGALGDLLMLHAVLRPLRALYRDFCFELCARGDAGQIFRHDHTYSQISRYGSESTAQAIIPLDGVLEVDHDSDGPDQHHRVELFRRFLLRGFDPMPKLKLDWTLPTSEKEVEFAEDWLNVITDPERPMVALQTHGSGPMKTLDPDTVVALAETLSCTYSVILIGQEAKFDNLVRYDHIYAPKGSVLDILEILKRCDAIVTMDSGILWLAHNANIPTVCLLGPTREEERLTLHPLYKDGKVVGINLAAAINCPPCFERALKCQWKFRCMRAKPNVVNPLVKDALRKVLQK